MLMLSKQILLASLVNIQGVALSLHYESPEKGMVFDTMVDELAQVGASDVSIVVQWSQADVRAIKIEPHETESPTDEVVRRVIRRAKKAGLRVTVFPILWVEKRALGEWRGTLKPVNEEAWWAAYRRFIIHYAYMAKEEGVFAMSVGSELASMEGYRSRWEKLVRSVRGIFSGRIMYSANWDHYEEVSFWDSVDIAGLTGYYRLTERKDASVAELMASWSRIRTVLLDWQKRVGKPFIFTELGYPSLDGAAVDPWNYSADSPLDLEEQRRCFEAFVRVWSGTNALSGVFFWNWWGPSDGQNRWYTLKGKPALAWVQKWLDGKGKVKP